MECIDAVPGGKQSVDEKHGRPAQDHALRRAAQASLKDRDFGDALGFREVVRAVAVAHEDGRRIVIHLRMSGAVGIKRHLQDVVGRENEPTPSVTSGSSPSPTEDGRRRECPQAVDPDAEGTAAVGHGANERKRVPVG